MKVKTVNSNKTLKLVMSALMAAMTCVATMVIKIPIPATGGYINLGDCIVLLSGIILGPVCGGLAAGLGSALADLLCGYVAFIPATFIIKSLMAVTAALLIKDISHKNIFNVFITGFIAEVIMVAGYFLFEALIMGYGLAAAGAIPGNAIQGIVGISITALLIPIIKQINIAPLREEYYERKRRNDEQ